MYVFIFYLRVMWSLLIQSFLTSRLPTHDFHCKYLAILFLLVYTKIYKILLKNKSFDLFIYLFVCLFVCLFIHLFIFI